MFAGDTVLGAGSVFIAPGRSAMSAYLDRWSDEDFTRGFLDRHQSKLLFGSDCSDHDGSGPRCQGSQTIAAVRRLAGSPEIERKLLYSNAKQLLRL